MRQVHEVGVGERSPGAHTAATLGLGLAEGKALLAALQRHLVAAQVDEHCRSRCRCDRCGAHSGASGGPAPPRSWPPSQARQKGLFASMPAS
jgi:hypothetical protein